jgi:hypothetical protein
MASEAAYGQPPQIDLEFHMMNPHDPKALAALRWFGYGRWEAPYWFVGMEPGGTDDHATYEAWEKLGGTELIDCCAHHLASKNTKWHGSDFPPMQPTWGRLIELVLGYEGKPADLKAVKAYQRRKWGSLEGDTASLVLSALHAPDLETDVARGLHREQRVATLEKRLKQHAPKFVVFYGKSYADFYASIAGTKLIPNGYAWQGKTLCALVQHPTAAISGRSKGWWSEKGREIHTYIEKGILPVSAQLPAIPRMSNNSSDIIRVLVNDNPKSGKSRDRFSCYRDRMTVAEYEEAVRRQLGNVEAKKCSPDLAWDIKHHFIRIERS